MMFYYRQVSKMPCNQSLDLVLPSSPHLEMTPGGAALLLPRVSLVSGMLAVASSVSLDLGVSKPSGNATPTSYGFLQGNAEHIG